MSLRNTKDAKVIDDLDQGAWVNGSTTARGHGSSMSSGPGCRSPGFSRKLPRGFSRGFSRVGGLKPLENFRLKPVL